MIDPSKHPELMDSPERKHGYAPPTEDPFTDLEQHNPNLMADPVTPKDQLHMMHHKSDDASLQKSPHKPEQKKTYAPQIGADIFNPTPYNYTFSTQYN